MSFQKHLFFLKVCPRQAMLYNKISKLYLSKFYFLDFIDFLFLMCVHRKQCFRDHVRCFRLCAWWKHFWGLSVIKSRWYPRQRVKPQMLKIFSFPRTFRYVYVSNFADELVFCHTDCTLKKWFAGIVWKWKCTKCRKPVPLKLVCPLVKVEKCKSNRHTNSWNVIFQSSCVYDPVRRHRTLWNN